MKPVVSCADIACKRLGKDGIRRWALQSEMLTCRNEQEKENGLD